MIKSDSYDNYIDKADIHSGKFGIRVDSSDVSKRQITIENSAIHTVTGHALDVRMSQVGSLRIVKVESELRTGIYEDVQASLFPTPIRISQRRCGTYSSVRAPLRPPFYRSAHPPSDAA